MGSLISAFTVGRNALKRDVEQSARAAMDAISLVRSGADLGVLKANDNGKYNVVRDLISVTGIIDRAGEVGIVTPVGEAYERLYNQNPIDAWRWVLTRALWLYTVPNGSQANVNKVAKDQDVSFDFFRQFLSVLVTLSAFPREERFLSFEEICVIYNDDASWSENAPEILKRIVDLRLHRPEIANSDRSFLSDLEDEYSIPRDNFAALFVKAFIQTGLFEYRRSGAKSTAIALSQNLDAVLQRRVRFVIDNPQVWDGSQDWQQHLSLKPSDLPEEVSLQAGDGEVTEVVQEPLNELIGALSSDIHMSGLTFETSLLERFVASLIAKRFVILTGLSGSGKTKIAQAFASWISPQWSVRRITFAVGEVVKSDRVEYRVVDASPNSVEFENGDEGPKVALPIGLINEWVKIIQFEGFDRTTPARTIRDAVNQSSMYSSQLNSFETHLKAAAFHSISKSHTISAIRHYEVVSVGPDWTSKESCLGYIDALNDGAYIRSTPIIDLLLRATAAPSEPFFLILDEMNLSHVERYFSEFLSAAESGEEIHIHGRASSVDGVPPTLPWPPNLFVIGTVNVDETTYMFSPKVLDRANTIEFRVSSDAMDKYLSSQSPLALSALQGRGTSFATGFVNAAVGTYGGGGEDPRFKPEVRLLFKIMETHGLEFGFRTAREMSRFMSAYSSLRHGIDNFYSALDAQVLQKLLPRLSGSRRRLEAGLCSLLAYCAAERTWTENFDSLLNEQEIFDGARQSGVLTDLSDHPLSSGAPTHTTLPAAHNKIQRMLSRLASEGFVSFSEG